MSYITSAQMVLRFGAEITQLIDRDNSGTEDTGVFAAVEADAAAIIDGYLRTVYTLPFATVPPQVVEIAAEILRYKLWGARAPEEVRRRYEDALARLRDIAKGLITLDDGSATLDTTGLPIEYTERTRTFDDDTLASFVGY